MMCLWKSWELYPIDHHGMPKLLTFPKLLTDLPLSIRTENSDLLPSASKFKTLSSLCAWLNQAGHQVHVQKALKRKREHVPKVVRTSVFLSRELPYVFVPYQNLAIFAHGWTKLVIRHSDRKPCSGVFCIQIQNTQRSLHKDEPSRPLGIRSKGFGKEKWKRTSVSKLCYHCTWLEQTGH